MYSTPKDERIRRQEIQLVFAGGFKIEIVANLFSPFESKFDFQKGHVRKASHRYCVERRATANI